MSMPLNDTGAVNTDGESTPNGEMDHEEVISFLGQDDDKDVLDLEDKPKPKSKTEPKEKKESSKDEEPSDEEKEEESEELDELAEIEEELEPPTEEQLELVTPVRRREILAKYPNLFKEFPYLERAYYREQKFTELLPTIEDAQEAVEAKKILDRFETDIMGGNTELILKAVKAENPKGFAKLVDEYLPVLAKVDEQSYYHILGNIHKRTIMEMVKEGRNSNNEALQAAAQLLNQFIFGTSEFKPPTALSKDEPKDNDKNKEFEEERRTFIKQQFESARTDLNTRINNTLKNTIDANIDPKKSMTDYVRKSASREALEMLETVLSRDTRFQALKDKLWEAAFKERFNKVAIDRIKSAYLSRAKTLLPTVIKKARIEALKGLGKRVNEEEDSSSKSPVAVGRPRSQEGNKGGKITKASEIPHGMRTIDFLNQD